jgi:thiamine-phosphate pyrophosphorylase
VNQVHLQDELVRHFDELIHVFDGFGSDLLVLNVFDQKTDLMKLLVDCRLYTFVDTAYLNGRDADSVAQQLCDGGSDIIQLRAKNSSPDEIRRMAEIILPVTQRAGVPLVINDHLPIAQEVGAEFCHLGQEDFFDMGYAHVSQLKTSEGRAPQVPNFPNDKVRLAERVSPKIGLSTHAPAQAERAIAAGADYVAIGPIYATGTKPTAKPVTLEYVRWAAANVKIPWFAIGGINLQTIDDVLAAGAKRICIVSAILSSTDIQSACLKFRRKLDAS